MTSADESRTASLFELGDFTLHSGARAGWRINAEALDAYSIDVVASLIARSVGGFGSVEEVPTGGLRLAAALRPMATTGPLLIVDDVLTTGASMEQHRNGRDAVGFVIFDRSGGNLPYWIRALFTVLAVEGNPQ